MAEAKKVVDAQNQQEREAHDEALKFSEQIRKGQDENLKEAAAEQVKRSHEWEAADKRRNTQAANERLRDDRAQERAREKARHHAATEAARQTREAARQARESTPEAVEHRARLAEQNEEMGVAQQVQAARFQQGDVMAGQMGPQELQQVVAQVGRNRMMNSSLGFTLAQQVDFYMSQLEKKMVADFNRGMGQQNRTGQNVTPFGGL